MSLSQVSFVAAVNWSLANSAATGFSAATESDNSSFTLTGISTTTWNQIYAAQITLTALGTTSIDLRSLTNLVNESFSFLHVLAIYVLPTGNMKIGPGAANGLLWFWVSAAGYTTIKAGGVLMHSDSISSTGTATDATHKTLDLTDTSNASNLVEIMVLGSTT